MSEHSEESSDYGEEDGEGDSEEESGKDWSELEEEARQGINPQLKVIVECGLYCEQPYIRKSVCQSVFPDS